MKVGLKDMKKAYKKVNIDKIEVLGSYLHINLMFGWQICWYDSE